jgi:hypothetical protein
VVSCFTVSSVVLSDGSGLCSAQLHAQLPSLEEAEAEATQLKVDGRPLGKYDVDRLASFAVVWGYPGNTSKNKKVCFTTGL